MEKYGIPVRDQTNHGTYWNPALSGHLLTEDHPRFRVMLPKEDDDGQRQFWFYVHQGIALANGASIEEVFGDENTHVSHHTLPHPVSINTPHTIEVLDRGEHHAKHAEGDVFTDWAEVEDDIPADD